MPAWDVPRSGGDRNYVALPVCATCGQPLHHVLWIQDLQLEAASWPSRTSFNAARSSQLTFLILREKPRIGALWHIPLY